MSPDLETLIKTAKAHQAKHPPTAADRREQAISFAYGNLVLDVPSTTRQEVADAYDRMNPA